MAVLQGHFVRLNGDMAKKRDLVIDRFVISL